MLKYLAQALNGVPGPSAPIAQQVLLQLVYITGSPADEAP
jgi:hypothetical protein